MEFQDQITELITAIGDFCRGFLEAGFLDRALIWVRDVLSWILGG